MNPEQEENNDADSTYTSTSRCIAQIVTTLQKRRSMENGRPSTAREH